MTELKPCPFCGGAAGFFTESLDYMKVKCPKCFVSTPIVLVHPDNPYWRPTLISIWNRRAEPLPES